MSRKQRPVPYDVAYVCSVIEQHYERRGASWCMAIIKRDTGKWLSRRVITHRAVEMDIAHGTIFKWRENEKKVIEKYWPDVDKILSLIPPEREAFAELIEVRVLYLEALAKKGKPLTRKKPGIKKGTIMGKRQPLSPSDSWRKRAPGEPDCSEAARVCRMPWWSGNIPDDEGFS